MGYEYDDDTATERLAEGRYRNEITPRWNIGDNPNGGYLLGSVVAPMLDVARGQDKPDPLSLTAHYLRPTSVGTAYIDVDVVRPGRRHVHLEARLRQETERVRVLGVFGDLTDATATPVLGRGAPPELPPPDECIARGQAPSGPAGPPSMMHRFESRFAPDTPWMTGNRSDTTVITGWIRFADGRPPDTASLPMVVDAFPPAVFSLGPTGWVPTIELTVHVRSRPVPGWLRCRFETRFVAGPYLEEDGEVWDESNRLVAQSRQLAMLLT